MAFVIYYLQVKVLKISDEAPKENAKSSDEVLYQVFNK